MKIFIENERGSLTKNIFDEKKLLFKKSVPVARPYPYPYGFIVGTTSGDGDNLDCFVVTGEPLKTGTLMDVEVIGMFEQLEDGKEDNKILAVLPGEKMELTNKIQGEFREFIVHVFDHLPGKQVIVGRFLGKKDAMTLIENSLDKECIDHVNDGRE